MSLPTAREISVPGTPLLEAGCGVPAWLGQEVTLLNCGGASDLITLHMSRDRCEAPFVSCESCPSHSITHAVIQPKKIYHSLP